MDTEFAVIGAGAMGSIIAAHLAHAGRRVVVLARGERAAQIASNGLQLTGLADLRVPVPVLTEPGELTQADVLIVATKAIQTRVTLEAFRHVRVAAALSVQNGVLKNELLSQAFGRDHILGAFANISGELLTSGVVMFTRNAELGVGELASGATGCADRVASALNNAGLPSRALASIESYEWSKFATWVALMAVGVMTRMNTWRILADPDSALVMVRLVREVSRLASALGIDFVGESMLPVSSICRQSEQDAVASLVKLGQQLRAQAPDHRVSTVQDLLAGRPLELAETIGFAVEKGLSMGLPLPLLDMAYRIASTVDPGRPVNESSLA